MALSQKLFLLTLLTLPLQLNKFFFQDYSFVLGIPIDYRAISIYLSDIFILAFITIFLIEKKSKLKEVYQEQKQIIVALFLLNYYLITSSILSSINQLPSLIFNLKTIGFSLLAVFAAFTLKNKKIFNLSIYAFAISVIWQWVLVIFQFLLQRSIGFTFLGERTFDVSTSAIAHIQFLNNFWLRPYGTFPHPNVLAAFFIVSAILFIGYFPNEKKYKLLKPIAFAAAYFSITFSFSKSALLALLSTFIINSEFIKEIVFKVLVLIGISILFITIITEGQINSIAERFVLGQVAIDIFKTNPFFGVGSNNFILELSKFDLFSISETRLLQPVHNIFLLVLSENGLLGLLIFIYLLFTISKSINSKPKLALFVSMLIFMSVDHFLWTLHQGRLLFFLASAYIITKNS